MAALTRDEKRARRLKKMSQTIDAQIMMTDDSDELMMLGTLFLAASKNIFLTRFSKKQTRDALHEYVDNALE